MILRVAIEGHLVWVKSPCDFGVSIVGMDTKYQCACLILKSANNTVEMNFVRQVSVIFMAQGCFVVLEMSFLLFCTWIFGELLY